MGIISCFIFIIFITPALGSAWVFDQDICTGLGDRLGIVLALSTLAQIENATIFFEWCIDATKAGSQNPLHYKFIPGWIGWQYSLHEFQQKLSLPSNLIISHQVPDATVSLPRVHTHHDIPAIQGIPFLYTMGHRSMYVGRPVTDSSKFAAVYQEIGAKLISSQGPDLVIHVRGPDRNTHEMDQHFRNFCTRRAVRKANKLDLNAVLITNNISHAASILRGLSYRTLNAQALDSMELLLSTRGGIIQHAGEGWSSFSSVPSMAKGIPLLTTYFGQPHRYDYFKQYGATPSEFFTCDQLRNFYTSVIKRLDD